MRIDREGEGISREGSCWEEYDDEIGYEDDQGIDSEEDEEGFGCVGDGEGTVW